MKKILAIFIVLLNIIFLPGCWDAREISQMGLVVAVGIDKVQDSEKFSVTVQIANPKPTATKKEGSTAAEPVWVLTAEGKTIFEAVRELSKISSKRIMWAHNYVVIIGETLAEENIAPVIDYFTHNPELRMKTSVTVSKGNAKEYIASKAGLENIPAVSLDDIISNAKLTALYVEGDMLNLSKDYYSQYKQPVLSVLSFEKGKILPSEGSSCEEKDTIAISGAAVFKKNKMVGMLSEEETRGVAWTMEYIENSLVTVAKAEQDNASVSVEISKTSSKIITSIKGGIPSIEIKVQGEGSIVEEDGTTDLSIDEFKKKVETLVNNQIVSDINKCLEAVQKKYSVDILGFANKFHVQHNEEWDNSLSKEWENIYPSIAISVSADIKIMSDTLMQLPEREVKKESE